MFRVMLVVLAFFLVIAVGGVIWLGTFPPKPATQQVDRVIPNDKFQQK